MKKYVAILLTMVLMLSTTWNVSAAVTVTGDAAQTNGEVTISGTVSNTDPDAVQSVILLVVNGGANINALPTSDIVFIDQVEPDGTAAYSDTFVMPVGKRTGTYDVYIGVSSYNVDTTVSEVGTPAQTDFEFASPAVALGSAKPAVNGANAFYYFITITLNDGTVSALNVKHYPTDMATAVASDPTLAQTQNLSLNGISNATIYVISLLKGIPDAEAERSVTTTATLTYTMAGVSGLTTDDTAWTALNTVNSD